VRTMARVALLLATLAATDALRPQTRLSFLQGVTGAVVATPFAAVASMRDDTPADNDMKGLLSSFSSSLDDKEAAAKQKKLDDGASLQVKLKREFEAQKAEAAKPNTKSMGVATPRVKKKVERRMGDSNMAGYQRLDY